MIYTLLLLQAAAAAPACAPDPMRARWAAAKPATVLTVGTPAVLAASAPAAAPAKPGMVASVPFTVAKRGTYTVALGSGGWIDVVAANGMLPASIAHGHDPCAIAKKFVAFDLPAGGYTLRLSGLTSASVPVAVLAGDRTPRHH